MLSPKLEQLKYVLISGKGSEDPKIVELHNRAYDYWKTFWGKIYTDAGSPESLVTDDFTRQDAIAILLNGDQIVAMHLYTIHHASLKAAREHRYFKFYPAEFFDFMKFKRAKRLISFEFLTVDPSWRKQDIGISLGEVMIGCGLKWLLTQNGDAAIAPARTDNKVNRMAYTVGSQCFQSGVTKRNFRVDLVTVFRNEIKDNPNPEVTQLIKKYWENRMDLIQSQNQPTSEVDGLKAA